MDIRRIRVSAINQELFEFEDALIRCEAMVAQYDDILSDPFAPSILPPGKYDALRTDRVEIKSKCDRLAVLRDRMLDRSNAVG